MRKILMATAAACGCGLGIAHAATVDTFAFTQTGWATADVVNMVVSAGAPDAGGTLTGSFTATVEPGGLIRLADLSAFSANFVDAIRPMGLAGTAMNRFSLTAFSYLTNGGPSSLDIAPALFAGGDCVGGAVPFSPACTADFAFSYSPGIGGAVFIPIAAFPVFVTTDQPVITLVSSVTTSIPEPSALSLLAASGLLGLLARNTWKDG